MAHASNLTNFLSKHKVLKGDDFSHMVLGLGFPTGSFDIPYDKTGEFHDLYYKHINNGGAAYLTEKHKSLAPILIDLDFRYMKDDVDVNRVYTQEHLNEFAISYMRVLNEYVDLSKELTIFILEMLSPKLDDKNNAIIKDKVHMMIPDVITTPATQFLIRNKVIESGVIDRVFKDCNFTNTAADIFDEQIIQKNNWLMYGSCEPKVLSYEVLQTLTFDTVNETLNPVWDKDIKELSIRNKNERSPIKADKVEEITAIEYEAFEAERVKLQATIAAEAAHQAKIQEFEDNETTQPQTYSKINIKELLEHIDDKYCDTRSDWCRICAALSNSGFSFEMFDTFSQRSTNKYNYKSAFKLWNDNERSSNKTIKFTSLITLKKDYSLV